MTERQDQRRDVDIVAACYRDVDADQCWLSQLMERFTSAHDAGRGLGFVLARELGATRKIELMHGSGEIQDLVATWLPILEVLDVKSYESFCYPQRTVALASSLAPQSRRFFRAMMGHFGAADMIGLLGYPAPGWAFSLFIATKTEVSLDGVARARLRKLRTHVESALRLRMFAPAQPSAIILPSGRVEHLASELKDTPSAQLLAEHAARTESTRSQRDAQAGALDTWSALVDGMWSLVEHVEPGGARCYHAYENPPHIRSARALTEHEAVVVELFTRGQSGKEIAYATGLSEPRVSRLLASAAQRLGFGSRSDLLRGLVRLRTQSPRTSPTCALTHAEHKVLVLVRAGLRNAEIAAARTTSVHTVANQVASLLRKTGAKSRRALLTSS